MASGRQLEIPFDDAPRWEPSSLEAALADAAGKPLRLVLTDIDGTMTDADGRVPARSFARLSAARALGEARSGTALPDLGSWFLQITRVLPNHDLRQATRSNSGHTEPWLTLQESCRRGTKKITIDCSRIR